VLFGGAGEFWHRTLNIVNCPSKGCLWVIWAEGVFMPHDEEEVEIKVERARRGETTLSKPSGHDQ
jgi:hypothetical protein